MTNTMPGTVLINGEENHSIDIRDRGFQYGDGVFTTLPVVQGKPVFLNRHLARLERDSGRLNIPYPGYTLLRNEVARLLAKGTDSAVLKIQLTRGIGGRGYGYTDNMIGTRVISLNPAPNYSSEIIAHGIKTMICQTRLGTNPLLAGIKHTNRLEQILARAELQNTDYLEGILTDQDGYITEGIMTNLFLVNNGMIATPKLDRCGVSGVMREVIMEQLSLSGYLVEESRLTQADIYQADEIFLTNSVIGIWSVHTCNQQVYHSQTVARAIRRELMRHDQNQLHTP